MSERQWDARTVALVWEGARPAIDGIEGKVRADLQAELEDLSHPSDLIFHLILLEDSISGPAVTAYGREGSDAIHLDFDPEIKWEAMRPNA